MELGLFSLQTQRDVTKPVREVYNETIDLVGLAEDIGFDTAWLTEHHFGNYSMCPSPLMMASNLAARTTRIKLGLAVLVLPLYHPLRVLEEIGMVDQLSDGRLVIGYGSGYQAFEFERFGLDLADNWEITHETMDILEMGIAEDQVTYDGKYYQIPEAPIGIPVLQKPRPQVFTAGAQPAYLARAAKAGYIPFVTVGGNGLDALQAVRSHIEKHYVEAGHTGPLPFAINRSIYVTDSKDDARDAAERVLYTARLVMAFRGGYEKLNGIEVIPQPYEGEPDLDTIIENLPFGDPESCAEKIAHEIKATGACHYSMFAQFGGLDYKRTRRSLERIGAEVLPLVDKALGGIKEFAADAMPAAAE
jgi:alkanesulfonate monooxygenase SsuD/methylene tetrahydromethanopterin reductase-like flavin-dependent oxidoreductase (luciferase family)